MNKKADTAEPLRVVIVADSLALPRPPTAGLVRLEETYPVVLHRLLSEAIPDREVVLAERGQRFRTATSVLNEWQEIVEYRKPHIVVVHVGIVDCAPRVFTQKERAWISRLRPARLRRPLLWAANRFRPFLVSFRQPRVYTGLADFENALRLIASRAEDDGMIQQLIFVNILQPTLDLEQRSPGYTNNCQSYNEVLWRVAQGERVALLDFNEIVRLAGGTASLTVDGMHPNAEGHELLARSLRDRIVGCLARKTRICSLWP